MSDLFIIPARGGSKGIPNKNVKLLGGKPLINYSIEVARSIANDENICVSTDNPEIKKIVEATGLKVPFLRPAHLATDHSGTYEVLLHALNFYQSKGKEFARLVLLQPTSPFRTTLHLQEAMQLYNTEMDMVASVKICHASPYFTLREEDTDGWLQKSKPSNYVRRQDAPEVYELNGSIYIINIERLKESPISAFSKVRKYVMDDVYSVDIDISLDWLLAEMLLEKGLVQLAFNKDRSE
jgi:CMP-N,N'-diacetyllegionaminic acid synthase